MTSLSLINDSKPARLECAYEYYSFKPLGRIYYCWTQNYVDINTREEAFLDVVSGIHSDSHSNELIEGFWLRWGRTNYFPHNFTSFFPNIKAVALLQSGLLEIRQSDLKTIPKIVHLRLNANKIAVLEDGLFDYNPALVYVDLSFNEIYRIGTKVFDNMKSLQNLNLEGNACVKSSGKYTQVYIEDTPDLDESLEVAITNCSGPDYFRMQYKFNNLQNKSAKFSANIFKRKFEKLQTEFMESKFNKSRTLHRKLNNLKVILDAKPIADPLIYDDKIELENSDEYETTTEVNQDDSSTTIDPEIKKIEETLLIIKKLMLAFS